MSFPLSSVASYFREDAGFFNNRKQSDFFVQGHSFVKHIEPLSRWDFITGYAHAGILFYTKVAESIISFLGTIFSLGSEVNHSFREILLEDIKGVITYFLAVPTGVVGFIAPGLINEYFLNIPSSGTYVTREKIVPDFFGLSKGISLVLKQNETLEAHFGHLVAREVWEPRLQASLISGKV